MRKKYLTVAIILAMGGSMLFSSCIGRFALTNKLLSWNNKVGSKFVNELVFIAFCVLPVYEVSCLADLLVLNSIEFWSGNNPLSASTKVIDTDSGRYLVKYDGKGYDIIEERTGNIVRLDFEEESQTWSVNYDGKNFPFMTMVDDSHVKMITPDGSFRSVELSDDGLMSYSSEITKARLMASR